jgi:hypothetical protein
MPLYETAKEPGFTASERTALITTIPISAIGHGRTLALVPKLDGNRFFIMSVERTIDQAL